MKITTILTTGGPMMGHLGRMLVQQCVSFSPPVDQQWATNGHLVEDIACHNKILKYYKINKILGI